LLPRFDLEAALPVVGRICRLLHGVPLALELAASQLRNSSCQAIAEAINRNLDILTVSFPDIPSRHRSLRAAFNWSWDYLSQSQQDTMARLTIFHGGFTEDAALAVAGASPRIIGGLVDKSFLRVAPSGRHSMHELIRQYSAERHFQLQIMDEAREQHLSYYLVLAEQAEAEFQGPKQAPWLSRLEIEYLNIAAALRFAVREGKWERAARLAGAMGWFWAIRGYLGEGSSWLDKLMTLGEEIPNPLRAKIQMASGWLAFEGGHYEQARRMYEASLNGWRETEELRPIADLLNRLGHTVQQQGDFTNAEIYCQESMRVYEQLGDLHGIALSLNRLGHIAQLQGDFARAATLVEESLMHRRELDDKRGMASCLNALGELARVQGDLDGADGRYRECLALCQELGDKRCVAGVSHNLGHMRQQQGDYENAQALFGEALLLYQEMEHEEGVALTLGGLAGVAEANGTAVRAAQLLGAAEAFLQTAGLARTPADQRDWERILAETRGQLDEEMFAAAWEAGRVLSLQEAVALALESVQ